MKRFLLVLLALYSLTVYAENAQQYLFRMLDTSSGLPDNNVRNMTMLPDGLMCIQTSSMLNLYDGASCRSYRYNPLKIPYTEYSGLSGSYYDKEDNVLWCTTRDCIWIFNLSTRHFEYDITSRLEAMGLKENEARSLLIDSTGRFWICGRDGRIWICDRSKTTTTAVNLPEGMTLPVSMAEHDGRMWMISMNGRLAEFDPQIGDFRTIRTIPVKTPAGSSSRMEIDITKDGYIWIMYDKEILQYDIATSVFRSICTLPTESRDLYTTIALDKNDNLWIGSARSGVSIIRKGGNDISTLPYLELIDGKKIYHHTDITKIFVDDQDGVWIATQSEGLLYWHKDIIHLRTINNQSLKKGDMNDESVKCMVEANDGDIYIGTIHGLLKYNPETEEINCPRQELKDELCISLYKDSKGRIWVGTFYNGVFCIDGDSLRHYRYQDISVDISYHESKPNFNCVRNILEDSEGRFWISVYGGIGQFDPETGNISMLRNRFADVERFMVVRDICEIEKNLLLVSGDQGRFLYSIAEDTIYTDLSPDASHTQTNQVVLDSRQLLWRATAEGLKVTDRKSGLSYIVDSRNGLPAGNIMSIAPDGLGNLWAASFSYISRIRPVQSENGEWTFAVSTYDEKDGVESGAFFQKSVLKHSNGHIYFGGAHGICELVPETMYQDRTRFVPQITSVNIAGNSLETWGEALTLKHNQSFITLEFSNLNYANPDHTTYLYKLENFDKDWRRAASNGPGTAQYTYLEPGRYTFIVKAANNGTDWSEETRLDITIRPPFHKSITAYVVYCLLLIGAVSFFIWWQLRQTRRKIQENKEKEKQRQRENLDQMKFRFFTNISHELRTPLSLIMLPLESIMKETNDETIKPKLQTMHHNAKELLSLVNHLLDFRKLEMGGEKLQLSNGNIKEFISGTVASFKDAAQRNGLTITFEDTLEKSMIVFDHSQMQKILNNLLSNALKFTAEGGYINVSLSQAENRMFRIEVSDSGIGIPAKDLPKIFDRFYRSENTELRTGSGIGLNLVKQYVEMHSGSISVKSEYRRGTTFTILMPMDLKADERIEGNTEIRNEVPVPETIETVSEERRSIMVVDDNQDFREYLVGELSESYTVSSAQDGLECIEMLKTVNPEVIICDVMMPNMDGFEVVKAIKNNIETSHIPVILLSARTSEDIRLEGYETGADAYLTKPFKLDILLARVRNLIDERNRRIASISKGVEISPSEVTITTIDQKLMTRIMEYIEKNMDNSDYSVEELASDVGMHRMNLYRKLQSIAGMTPSEFIRTMRLKRAAQLLLNDPNLTVSEVSDMVGFNTQKYFTRYFKEMFGVTPSQYRNKQELH